jgi:hypothetical protein
MEKDFTDNYSYSIETDYKSSSNHVMLQWTTDAPTQTGWYWADFGMSGIGVHPVAVYYHPDLPPSEFDYEWEIKDVRHWLGPLPVPAVSEEYVFHSTLSR